MVHTLLLLLIIYGEVPRNNSSHNSAYIIPPTCGLLTIQVVISLTHSCTFMYGMLKVHDTGTELPGYMSTDVYSPKLLTGLEQNLITAVNITSHQYISCLSILVNYDIYFTSC
jgi:hypothetical protein